MAMSASPLVSIVIPAFNGARYLDQAIDSALAQSYPNVEVLVVNDGSRDGGATERIALSYGDRIRYFRKTNGGVSTALNLGIEEMRGEYFSWLSHDDMYEREKVEKQVTAVVEYGAGAFSFCDFRSVSKTGAPISTSRISPKRESQLRALLAIRSEPGIHGCGLLIPRVLFDRYGMFDPALRCAQDYDLWFRFAGKERAVHVSDVLVLSREHPEQDGKRNPGPCSREADRLHSRMIRELTNAEVNAYAERSVEYLARACRLYRNGGYPGTALQLLKHACRLARETGETDVAIALMRECLSLENESEARRFWVDDYLPSVSRAKARPRVLVFCNAWARGGIERVVGTVLAALENRYEWIVLSPKAEPGAFRLAEGARHVQLPLPRSADLAFRIGAICALLDADVFMGHPNILPELLGVYALLKGAGVKTIACNHAHYFLPYHYPGLHEVAARRIEAFSHANAVTWPTALSAVLYSAVAANSALLPNPNPFKEPGPAAQPAGKVVLAVGRFYDAVKRLDRVFEVFSRVLVSHPDAKLVIAGGYRLSDPTPSGTPQSLEKLLAELAIPPDRILFVGETDNIESCYSTASLLVLTSDSEGFCLALLEAGAFGLPVVYFESPGLEDLVSEGENGFAIPQGDVPAMASKVSALLADPDLRQAMGHRAQALAKRFDQALVCERWDRLIRLVLEAEPATLSRELNLWFLPEADDRPALTRKAIAEYERNIPVLLSRTLVETASAGGLGRLTRLAISLEQEGLAKTLSKIALKVLARTGLQRRRR